METPKTISDIIRSSKNLPLDERLNYLTEEIIFLTELSMRTNKRLSDLEDNVISNDQTNNKTKNPSILRVLTVYYSHDYNHKGKTFSRYMLQLGGFNELFITDKLAGNKLEVQSGDIITCKIDGDKIKDIKVLHEI